MRLQIRLIAIMSVCFVVGCSSGSVKKVQPNGSTVEDTVIKSTLSRDTTPEVLDTQLATIVAGNTDFALKLFPRLDPLPDSNTFFSPYSVTQAFALLAPGARGTTLSEIEQVVFSFPAANLGQAFNKLDLLLAAKSTGTTLASGLQAPILNNANAIWGQKDFDILPEYLNNLAVNYGAGMHLVDFKSSTEPARQTINGWVEQQTNNRIRDLIPQGGVSGDTRLVLTNAIWFKADWAAPFPKSAINNIFTNRNGTTSSVPFMGQQLTLPYAQTRGCQAVDIPYAGGDLSMLVIMPDSGTFDTFLASFTPAILTEITGQLSGNLMQFSMPKFSFTKATPMASILQSLGMKSVFDQDFADLSGIDGKRDLSVSEVFHQAFIAVDEKGTEAAAATAIAFMSTTSNRFADLTVTIDHPFIFLIRDRQTGLILFMGKVVAL